MTPRAGVPQSINGERSVRNQKDEGPGDTTPAYQLDSPRISSCSCNRIMECYQKGAEAMKFSKLTEDEVAALEAVIRETFEHFDHDI